MTHEQETDANIRKLKVGTLFWMHWEGSLGTACKCLYKRTRGGCLGVSENGGKLTPDCKNHKFGLPWGAPTKIVPLTPDEQASMEAILKCKPERLYYERLFNGVP